MNSNVIDLEGIHTGERQRRIEFLCEERLGIKERRRGGVIITN
jgi:hypothetical protein